MYKFGALINPTIYHSVSKNLYMKFRYSRNNNKSAKKSNNNRPTNFFNKIEERVRFRWNELKS